jgi:uncharacterized protein (DUF1810 family)
MAPSERGRADLFDLARFLQAQQTVYPDVLEELAAGRKRTHWMWFVFPQFAGLGHSATARHFAIRSLAEAEAYLEHPVLGDRLRQCTRVVNGLGGRSALDIFGTPDHLKFCSCMTLFARVGGPGSEFASALDKYCGGRQDPATLALLGVPGDGRGPGFPTKME